MSVSITDWLLLVQKIQNHEPTRDVTCIDVELHDHCGFLTFGLISQHLFKINWAHKERLVFRQVTLWMSTASQFFSDNCVSWCFNVSDEYHARTTHKALFLRHWLGPSHGRGAWAVLAFSFDHVSCLTKPYPEAKGTSTISGMYPYKSDMKIFGLWSCTA